jgi:uncharacterized protein with HEPN domain
MRHAYDRVDPVRIWEIVTHDLPLPEAAAIAGLRSLSDMDSREGED